MDRTKTWKRRGLSRLMPNVNYGQLNDLLGHLLRYAVNRGHGAFQEVFDQDEVTPLQFMILELISENCGITHSEICKAMQTSAPVVTTTLKPLLADGRVCRREVSGDARRLAYELPPAGREWYAGIKPKIALSEARLAEALSEEERILLIGMLKRLAGVEKDPGEKSAGA